MKLKLLMKKIFTITMAIFISLFVSEKTFAQSTPCTAIGVDLTDGLQCPHSMTDYTVPQMDLKTPAVAWMVLVQYG